MTEPSPHDLPPLPTIVHAIRRIGVRQFDFSREVAVMAVVNRTPDSFYDRGRTFALDSAVKGCLDAERDGADWVDIGGAPFAPGPEIPAKEEAERVVPVVEAVRAASDIVISVDTFRPDVAHRSILAGADVINDTTGLADPELARVVADSDASVVITHSLASPRTPYASPTYADVSMEVADFLESRIERALGAGIPPERIIVDPGHDLNKNTLHSLELSRRLGPIVDLGYPTLVAVSNKDFIGESLDAERGARVEGSLVAAALCIAQGARIVRMHNVSESVAAVRMAEAILGMRTPSHLHHNMGERND